MTSPRGKKHFERKTLFQLKQKGITQENWLQNLDSLSDPEITALLNQNAGKWQKRLDEERVAQPSVTDRARAECLRDFGG